MKSSIKYSLFIRVNGKEERLLKVDLTEKEAIEKVEGYKRYASNGTQVWFTETTWAHRHEILKFQREKFEEFYDQEV